MKKIILPFLIIFAILTITNQSQALTATVNVTAVRIRESASTSSNIIINLYENDEVEILEDNGEWYKVQYREKIGYAKSEFFTKKDATTQNTVSNSVEMQNTTSNTTATNDVPKQVVTEDNLVKNEENTIQNFAIGETVTLPNTIQIRLIPNLATSSKIEVSQGANVTIQAELGNWYKVESEELSGWVTKSKLMAKTASMAEQPTNTMPEPEPEQNPVPSNSEPEKVENTTSTENTVPEQTIKQPEETTTPEPTETTTTSRTAIVIVETARVRKSASKKAEIIDVIDEDDIVTILGEEGDFYKITCSKISSGYISKSLVKEKGVTSRSATEERGNVAVQNEAQNTTQASVQEATTVTGNDIVQFAKQYLGYSYVLRL